MIERLGEGVAQTDREQLHLLLFGEGVSLVEQRQELLLEHRDGTGLPQRRAESGVNELGEVAP